MHRHKFLELDGRHYAIPVNADRTIRNTAGYVEIRHQVKAVLDALGHEEVQTVEVFRMRLKRTIRRNQMGIVVVDAHGIVAHAREKPTEPPARRVIGEVGAVAQVDAIEPLGLSRKTLELESRPARHNTAEASRRRSRWTQCGEIKGASPGNARGRLERSPPVPRPKANLADGIAACAAKRNESKARQFKDSHAKTIIESRTACRAVSY